MCQYDNAICYTSCRKFRIKLFLFNYDFCILGLYKCLWRHDCTNMKKATVYANTNTIVIVCMSLTVKKCSFHVQYKFSVNIHETITHKAIIVFHIMIR